MVIHAGSRWWWWLFCRYNCFSLHCQPALPSSSLSSSMSSSMSSLSSSLSSSMSSLSSKSWLRSLSHHPINYDYHPIIVLIIMIMMITITMIMAIILIPPGDEGLVWLGGTLPRHASRGPGAGRRLQEADDREVMIINWDMPQLWSLSSKWKIWVAM